LHCMFIREFFKHIIMLLKCWKTKLQ
jgi:hypothetical protein